MLREPLPTHLTGNWHFEAMWPTFHQRDPRGIVGEHAFEALCRFVTYTLIERMTQERSIRILGARDPSYTWSEEHNSILHACPVIEGI